MSEPVSAAGEPSPGPGRHSRGAIALRVLAAIVVAGAALLIQQLWLAETPARNTFGAKVRTKEIHSTLLDRTLPVRVVTPPRAPSKDRSLLIFLHGRGENQSSYLVDPMFEALAGLRSRAPVVAFPRGGPSSYWHDRDSGAWASYVLDELLPRLIKRFDINPARVAIGGISMGGFGAYNIARQAPGRFCAVGGHSPAIWESAGETADGAFDDAEDFARNDIIAAAKLRPSPFTGPRLWLDAGNDDPFLDGDRAFGEALRRSGLRPMVKGWPGGHNSGYWNEHWPAYLGFYARALNHCGADRRRARGDGDEWDPGEPSARDDVRGET